jgi:hypothetical protein
VACKCTISIMQANCMVAGKLLTEHPLPGAVALAGQLCA